MIDVDGPRASRWLGARIQSLIDVEATMVYTPERVAGGYQLGEFAISGTGATQQAQLRSGLEGHIRTSDGVWSLYDPDGVEPVQRNRVLAVETVRSISERHLPAFVVRAVRSPGERDRRLEQVQAASWWYQRWGTVDARTLRVILCDGQRMLGWVGGMQHARFDARAKALFSALVGPMQRRFCLEEHLVDGLSAALVPALLEEIAGAAYILNAKRQIVAMNGRARTNVAKTRGHAERIAEAGPDGANPDVTVVDLSARGVPRHSLVIERSTDAPAPELAMALRARYRLTPREVEVLVQIGKGMTNRAIAIALRCGERTVETHVSRILEKTDQASRAELVALVWSSGLRSA